MKLLSIIIPLYNRSNQFKTLLESIINSNLNISDYEIIVSDDSDNEKEISNILDIVDECRYRRIVDIKYVKNKYNRVGPSANRQNGLDNATGKWVLFVDDDDCITEFDQELLDTLNSDDISCIVTGYVIYDENNSIIRYTNNDDFLKILTHGKIYNRIFLTENNICYDVTAPAHEDIYFNYFVYSATVCYSGYSIKYLTDGKYNFYTFNHHEDSLSKTPGFYDEYITNNPKWFLNKFDMPIFYCGLYIDKVSEIFGFIQNEFFDMIIMYITMDEWGKASDENVDLYGTYFDKFKKVLCDKLDEEATSKKSIEVLQENGLIKNFTDLSIYFNTLLYILG